MTASAFKAAFADFKLVRGRKVAQFIFEVPTEDADAVLETLGGVPQPHIEKWAGICRIAPEQESKTVPEPVKERRKFHELPMAQQAGIRCGDPVFYRFLRERCSIGGESAEDYVRDYCGVTSRAELKPDTNQGNRWLLLESGFQAWLVERVA